MERTPTRRHPLPWWLRGLGVLTLVLMGASALYALTIAVFRFGQIGV